MSVGTVSRVAHVMSVVFAHISSRDVGRRAGLAGLYSGSTVAEPAVRYLALTLMNVACIEFLTVRYVFLS